MASSWPIFPLSLLLLILILAQALRPIPGGPNAALVDFTPAASLPPPSRPVPQSPLIQQVPPPFRPALNPAPTAIGGRNDYSSYGFTLGSRPVPPFPLQQVPPPPRTPLPPPLAAEKTILQTASVLFAAEMTILQMAFFVLLGLTFFFSMVG